jgi:hypothetical protein
LEANHDTLKAALKRSAEQFWQQHGQPFLLSDVAPGLKAEGIDYKAILDEETLKSFIKRTGETCGYRLVEHPTQRAKVGLVPSEAQFSFPDTRTDTPLSERSPASERRPSAASDRERVILAFLRALSRLNDDEIESVNIPVRVLIKLLGTQ